MSIVPNIQHDQNYYLDGIEIGGGEDVIHKYLSSDSMSVTLIDLL
jgi:hypothetical protein